MLKLDPNSGDRSGPPSLIYFWKSKELVPGNLTVKIWIDILTPKQALFFEPLYRELSREGHQLLITTRTYREAEQALQFRHLPYRIVGEHGGGSPYGKLLAGAKRIGKLARLIEEWGPNTAVSFSSPDAARVAFGLGVPHVSANDSPHSRFAARLSIPLSRYICSPWIIPSHVWLAYGAPKDGVYRYRALDAVAWLKRNRPNPRVLTQLSLDRDKPIVVLRTEESFAAYLAGKSDDSKPVVGPVIAEILKRKLDVQLVVSTRYGRQAPVLRHRFGNKVQVVDRVIDTTSLLHYATAFVGSGGTMTIEAALLGRIAVSCFPGEKPLYIKYLERKGLVQTILAPKRIVQTLVKRLASSKEVDKQKERGTRLLHEMEDPISVLTRVVRKTWRTPITTRRPQEEQHDCK
jgi:uncharacterized protein